MSTPEHLSSEQFTPKPAITGKRHEYGTASIYTEPHEVQDRKERVQVTEYHWHDGDPKPTYIEAKGFRVKDDGTVTKQRRAPLVRPPEHVLEEFKRMRGEA